MDSLPLRLDSGKVVGSLSNGVARFKMQRSRHYFRRLGGYSLDADVMRQVQAKGGKRIEIADTETGRAFSISVEKFLRHAEPIGHGFGPKLVCPERHYDNLSDADQQPPLLPESGALADSRLARE